MDPIALRLMAIAACFAGSVAYPLIGTQHPNMRNWAMTVVPSFLFAAFCSPVVFDGLVAIYGERMPWLTHPDALNSELAFGFLSGFASYGILRTAVSALDQAMPYGSDNLVVAWIVKKIRVWFGLPVTLPPDAKHVEPDSDMPSQAGRWR